MINEKCNRTYTLKQCEKCFKFSYQLCLNETSPYIKHFCNDNLAETKFSIEDVLTQIDSPLTPQIEEEQTYDTFLSKIENFYTRTISTCDKILKNLTKISEMIPKLQNALLKYKKNNESILHYLKGVFNIVTFDQESIEEKISQMNDILEFEQNQSEIKNGEQFLTYIESVLTYLNSQFILKNRKTIQFSPISETEKKETIIGFNVIKFDIDINNNGYDTKEEIIFTLSQGGFIHGYVFDSNQFNHIVSSSGNDKVGLTSIEKLNEDELVAATVDGRLVVWKMRRSGQARYEGIKGKFLNTYTLEFCFCVSVCSGGITKILKKDEKFILSSTNKKIYLIDRKEINSKNEKCNFCCVLKEHRESVNSILITSNDFLVSATSKQVILWSKSDNSYTVEHIFSNIHCCHSNSLYEHNDLLFIGGKNAINIICIKTFQIKQKIIIPSTNYISSFIPYDSSTIIAGGSNGNLFLLEKSNDDTFILNSHTHTMKIKQQIVGFFALSGQDVKIFTHSCYDINSLPYFYIPK